MKIYKNDEKKEAWLNAGYISEKGKNKGKRVTKRMDLEYESVKLILDEDWIASMSNGEPNGNFYYDVSVPLILGQRKVIENVPGVYDTDGNVIVEPYEKETGKTIYFIDWDAMQEQV